MCDTVGNMVGASKFSRVLVASVSARHNPVVRLPLPSILPVVVVARKCGDERVFDMATNFIRFYPFLLILSTNVVAYAVECLTTTSSSTIVASKSSKSCPDFKDGDDDRFCCPSSIDPGMFYCCDQREMTAIEQQQSAIRLRQFVRKYLVVLIGAAFGIVLLCLVIIIFVCYRCDICPLARRRRNRRKMLMDGEPHRHNNRYCPVDLKPSAYEAPPPYALARQHADWHCLFENEVNRELLQREL